MNKVAYSVDYLLRVSFHIVFYVWIEDTLYLSDGSSLYKCKNGEKQRFYIEQQNPAHPVDFSVLQTDGERLYVVTSSGKLYLLTLNETETVYELKNLY